MNQEINFKEILRMIKKRLGHVVVISVLFTIIAGVYSVFLATPKYQSTAKIILNADEEYRKTLEVIIKDSTVLENVSKELQLDRTEEDLADQIDVQSIDGSQVVSISVVDPDPIMAANIANTTAKEFQKQIAAIINVNKSQLISNGKVFSEPIIQLLSHASKASQPINDHLLQSIMLGFVIGIATGIGLVFLLEYFDDSVKSDINIEELLGAPVIGKISKIKRKNLKARKMGLQKRGRTIGS